MLVPPCATMLEGRVGGVRSACVGSKGADLGSRNVVQEHPVGVGILVLPAPPAAHVAPDISCGKPEARSIGNSPANGRPKHGRQRWLFCAGSGSNAAF